MDEHQVGEAELDRVHEHDLDVHDLAEKVEASVRGLTTENFTDDVAEVKTGVDELLAKIEKRDDLLTEVFPCRS